MEAKSIRCLLACAALAAGEGCAALLPSASESWPVFVLSALWVFLVGYGFAMRGWPSVCLFLAGVALFYRASVSEERMYREHPWMREARPRQEPVRSSPLKRDLSERVGIGLEHHRETAALNRAILLGERKGIPQATKRTFVESGTVHVFAISGLHVMIVARVLMFLVALTFVPLRFHGAVALAPVWGYVILIGAPPSALRAALTASLSFLSPLFWRRADGVVAWGQSFLIIHVLFPRLISDTGSQLSHVVVLAIILAGRISRGKLLVTFAAWSAGLPIAAMEFGRITPGGLVANLVLIAAAAFSVASGTLGTLASYLWRPLAVHFNNLAALMTDAMVGLSEAVSRLPCSNFEIVPWGPFECIGWYAAFGLFLYLAYRVRLRRNLV